MGSGSPILHVTIAAAQDTAQARQDALAELLLKWVDVGMHPKKSDTEPFGWCVHVRYDDEEQRFAHRELHEALLLAATYVAVQVFPEDAILEFD